MQTNKIRTLATTNAVSFLILEGGEYYSCILPRLDLPAFIDAIYTIIHEDESEIEFTTEYMEFKLINLKTSVCIEGHSYASPIQFRIVIDKENVKNIADSLNKIVNDNIDNSHISSFSWVLGGTKEFQIS